MLPFSPDLRALLRKVDDQEVFTSLVGALTTIASQQSARTRASASPEKQEVLARARRVFQGREQRLSHERRLMDELLGELPGTNPPPSSDGRPVPQQELVLHGSCGGKTGGRFRLRNDGALTETFGFRTGTLQAGLTAPPVAFTPGEITLAPEAVVVVRVEVDLSATSRPTSLSMPVDITVGPILRQRLWLEVQVS